MKPGNLLLLQFN